MKKIFTLFVCSILLMGCAPKEEVKEDTSNGPIIETNPLSDEEKILLMIQSCIDDYNQNKISEREEYFQTQFPPLSIEVSSLPEIISLSDLQPVEEDTSITNTAFVGEYQIDEKYSARFTVYKPTTDSFWLNGKIEFLVDIDQVSVNNAEFANTKAKLDRMLRNAESILNTLHGINATLDFDQPGPEEGYYRYLPGPDGATSIYQLKSIAESIYTKDFLEENYYITAFEGDYPLFLEKNGQLYCAEVDIFSPFTNDYDTSRIIATKEEGDFLYIDILMNRYGQLEPTIYRLVLVSTEEGYRFPTAI